MTYIGKLIQALHERGFYAHAITVSPFLYKHTISVSQVYGAMTIGILSEDATAIQIIDAFNGVVIQCDSFRILWDKRVL